MMSYALASIDKRISRDFDESKNKGFNPKKFKFFRSNENSIIRELEKYNKVDNDILNQLNNVLSRNKFNVRMLVAADIWFRGNNYPQTFKHEYFEKNNYPLISITKASFDGKRNWDKDSLFSLIIYANFLKNTIYKITDDVIVITPDEDDISIIYDDNDY